MARAERGEAGGCPGPLAGPTEASAAAPNVSSNRAAAHRDVGACNGAQRVDSGPASAIHFFLAAACREHDLMLNYLLSMRREIVPQTFVTHVVAVSVSLSANVDICSAIQYNACLQDPQ